MNDMTSPPSAARLSEDIGDVLSAIRRLIAEDEALSSAREQRELERSLTQQAPAEQAGELAGRLAAGGDVLAHRYGGNAALARRMALGAAASARRPRPASGLVTPVAEAEGHSGEALAAMRFARVRPAEMPQAIDADMAAEESLSQAAAAAAASDQREPTSLLHPFEAELLQGAAREDAIQALLESADETDETADLLLPELDEPGAPVRPDAATPLRLRPTDRVSSTAAAGSESPAHLNRMIGWKPWSQPETSALDAAAAGEDEDDFAAQFDALAGGTSLPVAPRALNREGDYPAPAEARTPAEPPVLSAPTPAGTPVDAVPVTAMPAAEVSAEPPVAPMPILRARSSSRWARIEPPLTRRAPAAAPRPAPVAQIPTPAPAPAIVATLTQGSAAVLSAGVALQADMAAVPVEVTESRVGPVLAAVRGTTLPNAAQALRPLADGPQDNAAAMSVQGAATDRVEPGTTAPVMDAADEAAGMAGAEPVVQLTVGEPAVEAAMETRAVVHASAEAAPEAAAPLEMSNDDAAPVAPLAAAAAPEIGAPVASADRATVLGSEPVAESAPPPVAAAAQPAPAMPAAQAALAEPAAEMPAAPVEALPSADALNEAAIREVIREMIQEELHGELGQRFSRNLRAVIRREVAAAIEDQLDRL